MAGEQEERRRKLFSRPRFHPRWQLLAVQLKQAARLLQQLAAVTSVHIFMPLEPAVMLPTRIPHQARRKVVQFSMHR